MHGFNTQSVNAKGQLSISGIARTQTDIKGLGMGGGYNDVVSSQGIVGKPQLGEETWAIVDDFDGNKHAWSEADVTNPDNVKVLVGGRRGTISDGSSGSGSAHDDQPAYEYNGIAYGVGTIIRIKRDSYFHWGITWAVEDAGSGSGAGNTFNVTCNNDGSVTVTRA